MMSSNFLNTLYIIKVRYNGRVSMMYTCDDVNSKINFCTAGNHIDPTFSCAAALFFSL